MASVEITESRVNLIKPFITEELTKYHSTEFLLAGDYHRRQFRIRHRLADGRHTDVVHTRHLQKKRGGRKAKKRWSRK